MSYISDFLASDGSEEAYREFKRAAQIENARERYYEESQDEDLVIDYDEYEGENYDG